MALLPEQVLSGTTGVVLDQDPRTRMELLHTLTEAGAMIGLAGSLSEVTEKIVVQSVEFVVVSGATLDMRELMELFVFLIEHGRGCHAVLVGAPLEAGRVPPWAKTVDVDSDASRLLIACTQAAHGCRGYRMCETVGEKSLPSEAQLPN